MKSLNLPTEKSHRVEGIYTYKGANTAPAATVVEKGERMYQRFFYILEGTVVFILPTGKKLVCEKNSVVYLPYDYAYKSYWINCNTCRYIGINFTLYDENSEIINLKDEICIAANDSSEKYLYLFKNIHQSWISAIAVKFRTFKLFYEILENFQVDREKQNAKQKHFKIYRALLHIENHYTENTSPEELAKMCQMSLTSFRRTFKEELGISPVKYRNRLKMLKAKELLETGEYSITEIAEALNFTDIYYFSKMFKAKFGKAPTAFRKQIL